MFAGDTSLSLADYDVVRAQMPHMWQGYANRSLILDRAGELPSSLRDLRRAIQLAPDNPSVRTNLLMAMIKAEDSAAYAREARDFSQLIERLHGFPAAPAVIRKTGSRLRVGYFSPDFRLHSCAWFLEPLFEAHDRQTIELFAYSNVRSPDAFTARFASLSEHWLAVGEMSDEAIAARVRADGIDVLVDLAGLSSGGRPGLFARRPAGVQVNWLGFNATTGIRAIDWKLVDPWLFPGGENGEWFAEGLWHLSRLSHCYRPPAESPPPMRRSGRPRFGSFNMLGKLSPATIAVWAAILHRVPEAELVLKADQSGDAMVRARLQTAFAAHGIAVDRLVFLPYSGTIRQHLACYAEIDVALDPFPYNGTTTTCEALWMGVPVVTLAGETVAGRVGASLVSATGLGDLAAVSREAYVDLAARLIADTARLNDLRMSLRNRVQASPLRDEAGFARAMETAFAGMIDAVAR
jgi:predicted O-linked N-acetylglucosamine transferase (SPINDLY family)